MSAVNVQPAKNSFQGDYCRTCIRTRSNPSHKRSRLQAGILVAVVFAFFPPRAQAVEGRATNGKSSGPVSKPGPKKLEDLEAEGKLAMDRLEDIANYMGDYRDIVDEYAVREAL